MTNKKEAYSLIGLGVLCFWFGLGVLALHYWGAFGIAVWSILSGVLFILVGKQQVRVTKRNEKAKNFVKKLYKNPAVRSYFRGEGSDKVQ